MRRKKMSVDDLDRPEHKAHLFAFHKAQIKGKYMLTSYGMAFLMVGFIVMTFMPGVFKGGNAGDYGVLLYLLISGTLFPFARITYDIPIGFRINYYLEHNIVVHGHYIAGIIYFPVFFLGIVLGPFGVLYLVIKGVQYHGQILEKKEQEHRDNEALQKEVAALRKEIAQEDEKQKQKGS